MKDPRSPVWTITLGEKTIILVGTAHVSKESVILAEQIIREQRPDMVALELDAARAKALANPDDWKKLDILQVLKQGRIYALLSQVLLSSYQKRLGAHLDTPPGAEMKRSLDVAHELAIPVTYVDREIKITLKRVWAALSLGQKFGLLGGLLKGIFDVETVTQEDIERLKERDALAEALKEFSDKFPGVKSALIDERDQYLAAKIKQSPGKKVVAILGAAHIPGILVHIERDYSLAPLEEIPPPTLGSKVVGNLIPVTLIALLIAGFFVGKNMGGQMIADWALINALGAGLGALLALAHPVSIVGAALSAPFTPLHPLLASGFVSGGVEAWLRKPQVADFETIADDIGSVSGIYKNRVLRVFLVVLLTNLCGALSALGALGFLTSILTGS